MKNFLIYQKFSSILMHFLICVVVLEHIVLQELNLSKKKFIIFNIYIYIFISSYYQLIFVQQVNCPFEHKSMMIKYLINKNFIQKKNNEFNK